MSAGATTRQHDRRDAMAFGRAEHDWDRGSVTSADGVMADPPLFELRFVRAA